MIGVDSEEAEIINRPAIGPAARRRRSSPAREGRIWGGFALLLALTIPFLGPSCRPRTDEDVALETIDTLARLAEKRDLEAIMARFAADYSDFEGRDRDGLRSLLASHFTGRTGIVVHTLGRRLRDFDAGRASIEAEVALSSGGAEALRRLVRISPDIYRLRVELVEAGEGWLVWYAEWTSIGLGELLPESLPKLRQVFPRL
jgi:hypothetical protein